MCWNLIDCKSPFLSLQFVICLTDIFSRDKIVFAQFYCLSEVHRDLFNIQSSLYGCHKGQSQVTILYQSYHSICGAVEGSWFETHCFHPGNSSFDYTFFKKNKAFEPSPWCKINFVD